VTQLASAARALILNQPAAPAVGYALLWSAGILLVAGPAATLAYRRRA
jgi:hypothetical protein